LLLTASSLAGYSARRGASNWPLLGVNNKTDKNEICRGGVSGMWIEEKYYHMIREWMPIPTVDAIITFEGKFLLLKRNNPPVQGEWWLPGGRVRKGEALEDAVRREVREETGLTCQNLRQVGVINQIFPECHTISIYYRVDVATPHVTVNPEHSDYRWVSALPQGSHRYLKTMIEATGLPT
jgi:8-oxo-dGTP diphosphatase